MVFGDGQSNMVLFSFTQNISIQVIWVQSVT